MPRMHIAALHFISLITSTLHFTPLHIQITSLYHKSPHHPHPMSQILQESIGRRKLPLFVSAKDYLHQPVSTLPKNKNPCIL